MEQVGIENAEEFLQKVKGVNNSINKIKFTTFFSSLIAVESALIFGVGKAIDFSVNEPASLIAFGISSAIAFASGVKLWEITRNRKHLLSIFKQHLNEQVNHNIKEQMITEIEIEK